MRISSTPLNTYIACPRKWYFDLKEGLDKDSEPIAFGSLFHGYAEAWIHNGFPPASEVRQLVHELPAGDYGHPSDQMNRPKIVEWVERVFGQVTEDPQITDLFEHYEVLGVEVDITPFEVKVGNQVCRGRIDLLLRHRATGRVCLADWKTRGDLKYAPFTPEDFETNAQFAYYAAVYHARHPEEEQIEVLHLNVLRDTGRLAIYGTIFDREYLEKMYRYFNRILVPEMERAVEVADGDPSMVKPDRSACYKYGKCEYFDKCGLHKVDGEDAITSMFRNMRMQILSKEAPPEVKALSVPQKPISVLDGVSPKIAATLQEAGLFTLGDLRTFKDDGGDLTLLKGVGAVTEQKISDALEHYYSEYEANA